MFFIWQGLGFLVIVIYLVVLAIGQYLSIYLTGNEKVYIENNWLNALFMAISGVIIWYVGNALKKDGGKTYIEKDTGKEVFIAKKHTFFFLNLDIWGYISLIFALVILIFDK